MRNIIKKLYQSIVEEIPDMYEEIYFGAQDKKIKLQLEDIFPLCQFSIYDSSISLLTKSLKICYNSGEILFIYQIRGVS